MCHIAYVPGCFCLCQAVHSLPFLGLISRSYQDLLVPLRAGPVHSQQARFSLLHPLTSLRIDNPIQSFRLGNNYLQSLLTASTSSYMDLTAVVPALMEGIAQEVGVPVSEFKVILVGDETQLDLKPFQTLKEQYDRVEWDTIHRDTLEAGCSAPPVL